MLSGEVKKACHFCGMGNIQSIRQGLTTAIDKLPGLLFGHTKLMISQY